MNKIDGYIGLAAKARKLAFGSAEATDAARKGKAHLVIMADDASERTKKLVLNKCKSFGVTVFTYHSKEELGRILGKNQVSAIAVCDKGFSMAITKIFGGDNYGKDK
jgi:ribosomal protein L7Ae-like RNA K-turn-binding protein